MAYFATWTLLHSKGRFVENRLGRITKSGSISLCTHGDSVVFIEVRLSQHLYRNRFHNRLSIVVFSKDADGSYAMFSGISMSYLSEERFQLNERQWETSEESGVASPRGADDRLDDELHPSYQWKCNLQLRRRVSEKHYAGLFHVGCKKCKRIQTNIPLKDNIRYVSLKPASKTVFWLYNEMIATNRGATNWSSTSSSEFWSAVNDGVTDLLTHLMGKELSTVKWIGRERTDWDLEFVNKRTRHVLMIQAFWYIDLETHTSQVRSIFQKKVSECIRWALLVFIFARMPSTSRLMVTYTKPMSLMVIWGVSTHSLSEFCVIDFF